MSTTNLFVELLVIGVGAAGWLILFTLTALGYNADFVENLVSTPAAIVPAVVFVYLLGIITDRLADSSLHFLRTERKRRRYFASEDAAFKDRGYVLTNSPYFATQFDYSRSRQRICRGWTMNFILLAISLNVLLWFRQEAFVRALRTGNLAPRHLSYFATSALLLFALASWFAWEKLYDTELKRIRDQASLLRSLNDNHPRSHG